jgi:hypothetical protein
MATRSLIAIENPDGTYDAVYCHFDGYPEGVGRKLEDHYTDPEKIRALISRGSMSMLSPELDKCEFYTKSGEELKNWCGMPHRKLQKAAKNTWCEYIYRFVDGKWTHEDIID